MDSKRSIGFAAAKAAAIAIAANHRPVDQEIGREDAQDPVEPQTLMNRHERRKAAALARRKREPGRRRH